MWELYTYGGGDFLRMILTGVAQIFGNNDYGVALKSAAMLGFISVLIYAAFQKGKLDVQWIIGVIMIVMIAIVPKVDVIITDRIVPANSSVVGNVPLGLGLTATVFSKFGDWTTRAFETVFSLPNQMQYSGNGLLFANHLVEESTRFEMTSPTVASNFSDFWKSCVYYDLLLDLYSWSDLLQADDLMSFLGSNTSVTRSFTYDDGAGGKSILNCRAGLNNQLSIDLTNEITSSSTIHGVRLVANEETRTAAVTRFAATLPVAYQHLTGLSKTNAEIIGQNVLANSLRRGIVNFANEADAAAAAQDFALARAEQERKTTFSVMGQLAKRMLPILRNIFEAFIYAVFPLVMILAMLPVAGKVLLSYAKILFWINMWAPLYAVLHFAMSYFGQEAASAAMVQAGAGFPTGLTAMTNTGLGNVLESYSAMAGYLSLSIPLIAWMMVSQSGAVMAGLAGRMMQSYDAPVSKASDAVTGGNIDLGNMRYETNSAFQSNSAPSDLRGGITAGDGIGNTDRIGADGRTYSDMTTSSTPLSINYGSMAASSAKANLSEATSRETSSSLKVAESNAGLRSEIDAVSERVQSSEGAKQNFGTAERQSMSQARQDTDRVVEQFAEKNDLSVQDVKAASAEIAAKAHGGFAIGDYFGGKAEIAGRVGTEQRAISQEHYTKALEMMASQEYSSALRAEGMAVRDTTASFDLGTSESTEAGLTSALNHQHQATQERSEALRDVDQASKTLEYAQQRSAQIQAKGDDGFFSWLAEEKGMSNSDIRDLINDANHGDIPSMQHRDAYAQEYVQSELASYSQNQGSPSHLEGGGSFNGSNGIFDGVDRHGDTLRQQSLDSQRTEFHDRSHELEGYRDGYTDQVYDRATVPTAERVEEGVDRAQQSADEAMRSPGSAIMTPLEENEVGNVVSIRSRQNAIEEKVTTEQEKGVVDRVAGYFGLK